MNAQFKFDYYRKFGKLPPMNFDTPLDPVQSLSSAFDLPPEKAIEFFKSKGYEIGWDWKAVAANAQRQSFTVAKVMSADVLQFFKDELDKALKEGKTFEQFKAAITPRLEEAGWKGKREVVNPADGSKATVNLTSPSRLKTIYQTNMQSAMMNGRYEGMKLAEKTHPYGVYSNADPRTPICRSLAGKVVRLDDPNLRTPPFHYGCKTRIDPMSERNVIREGLTVEPAAKIYKSGGGVPESFDSHPDTRWKPDVSGYDPAIGKALRASLGGK